MTDAQNVDVSTPITDVLVPAYEGRAVRVGAGDLIRLTNVEGEQIADMWAVNSTDPSEILSCVSTRSYYFRIYPRVGDQFFSNRDRAMLTFLEDTSPGMHDMICCACNPYLIGMFGGDPNHPSCSSNFQKAVASVGLAVDATPDPVDFFQHTPVEPDGEIKVRRSPAKAGDYVLLRAEMELFFVVASCSFDLEVEGHRVNGDRNTPIRIEVFSPASL